MYTKWNCSCEALNEKNTRVLAFNAEDSLMRGYVFDILLLVSNVDPKEAPKLLEDIIKSPLITLKASNDKGDTLLRHGMATKVSYLFSDTEKLVIRLELRPRSHKLTLSMHSRIFINMNLPEIFTKTMKEEGFVAGQDFENGLQSKYEKRPFTCQYNEFSSDFISRFLERSGAYSYVRQDEEGDVLILSDCDKAVEKLPIQSDLTLSQEQQDAVITHFFKSIEATATKFVLRDYSSEQSEMTTKQAENKEKLYAGGEINIFGLEYLYGEVDINKDVVVEDDTKHAKNICKALLQATSVKAHTASGESSIPWLQAGYSFTIDNEEFQLISIKHSCNMASDSLEERVVRRARHAGFVPSTVHGYSNAFTCFPLELGPYAPLISTKKPQIAGFLNAVIDAAGDGKYAEVDNLGRYKVQFYFPEKVIHSDSDEASAGNKSIPVRMMQSHVGDDSGINFPLLKGAEVLVVFTGGDPDRPVIMGAIPNAQNMNIVTSKNHDENLIQSPGGHQIQMKDTETSKSMTFQTPGGQRIAMYDEEGKQEIRIEALDGVGYMRFYKM